MDTDALKSGLRNALKRLPKEVLQTVPPVLFKYAPVLEPVIPGILDDLGPHIGALMTEKALGVLDADALFKAVEEVFTEFGLADTKAA
jgi:hypothetical protein